MDSYFIVDEQEAVVLLVELFYLNGGILAVVALHVQTELAADVLRVDGCGDSCFALVKQGEHSIVHIVVYQCD